MLSPEVVDFQAPNCTFLTKKANEHFSCSHIINNFFYNHLVSVILPDTFKVPESFTNCLITDCDYYKISNLNLKDLISVEFIKNFIKSGKLSLLSLNTRLDCDNCAAITPKGNLILKLNKTTYQSLGLEGQLSHFDAKNQNSYIVKLNLKLASLRPGKASYEKAKICLGKLNFTVLVSWAVPSENVCPSSIAKYFSDLGYKVKLCKPKFSSYTHYSIKTPTVVDLEEHDLFVEWLGAVSLGSEVQEECANDYLTSYTTPEPNTTMGQVKVLQWRGFFLCSQIQNFWTILEKFRGATKPWFAMYVQGFSDSPVAWGEEEHHYYTNGDNGYVFVADGGKCLISQQICSRKRYKSKSKVK